MDALQISRSQFKVSDFRGWHRSEHSLRQFDREFIQNNPVPGGLPPAQHKPIGYLRGQHAANQSRLRYQLAEAAAIIRRLCA